MRLASLLRELGAFLDMGWSSVALEEGPTHKSGANHCGIVRSGEARHIFEILEDRRWDASVSFSHGAALNLCRYIRAITKRRGD